MPKQNSVILNEAMDPDIAAVVHQAEKYIGLAVDKAVANSIDPKRFPIKKGTLEHLLLQRLKRAPAANPTRGETRADLLKESRRRMANAQRHWKERYTATGQLRKNAPRTSSYYGALATAVRLDSNKPIADQLPPDHFFGGSKRLLQRMDCLAKPVNDALPVSKDAYQWLKDLTGASGQPSSSLPTKTKLECVIKEVNCIDETDGFMWTEAGADEIYLGGMKVDPCAVVSKIPGSHVKDFDKDGDTKSYPPPTYKVFADFSLQDAGEWPRAFFATYVLAEKDMGGLGEFLSELVDLVRVRLAAELAASLGPEAAAILLAAAVPGVVAAAIAIALMVIVFIVVIAVFEAIKRAWEDDLFEPLTVMLPIDSPAAADNFDWVSEDLWGPLNFLGHGGHYQLFYSWRCV